MSQKMAGLLLVIKRTIGLFIAVGLKNSQNVWHEGVFPLTEKASFYDKQGKVHARISCNIAQEFGVFLSVPIK